MNARGIVVLAGLLVGCGSSESSPGQGQPLTARDAAADADVDESACRYPAGVTPAPDGSVAGCFASRTGQICEVSNGATVLPDGGVMNGTESCSDECKAGKYEMTCSGDALSSGPDPSLGCAVVPIPTPSSVLFYCCPCAR